MVKEINYVEAERLIKRRLDRRKSYAVPNDGKPDKTTGALVFQLACWVESCSGCYNTIDGYPDGEYPSHPKHNCAVGAGCYECAYKGVRRQRYWVPLVLEEEMV